MTSYPLALQLQLPDLGSLFIMNEDGAPGQIETSPPVDAISVAPSQTKTEQLPVFTTSPTTGTKCPPTVWIALIIPEAMRSDGPDGHRAECRAQLHKPKAN